MAPIKIVQFPYLSDNYGILLHDEDSQQTIAIDAGDEKKSKIRPKDQNIDDEYDMNKSNILEKALYAKFSQNVSLKEILKSTNDAKLVHYKRGSDAIVLTELMRVREKLNK